MTSKVSKFIEMRPTADVVGMRQARDNDRVQTPFYDYENWLTADGAGHTGSMIDNKNNKLVSHSGYHSGQS